MPQGTESAKPHVVIVGGGFGGLSAARELAGAPVRVTIVDRRNYHLFQPLLYQVATAGLSPGDIAYPIRSIVRRYTNTDVLLAELRSVDVDHRRLVLEGATITYDRLILAAGASHSYFGHDEWEPAAPGLKSIEDALEIRRRILLAFEAAEREEDERARSALLTFVVVGGGPTGVELAGALVEIALHTLAGEFRNFDPRSANVILLEGGTRLLPAFPEDLSRSAEAQLVRLGVEVRTGSLVEEIDAARGVRVRNTGPAARPVPEWIEARTVLWAAGVAPSPVAASLRAPLDRTGRVLVEPDLTVPGHPEIWVIGDLAAFLHRDGKPLPGLAPVAMQQGRAAARNVLRSLRGEAGIAFVYTDKGSLATIGRAAAVAQFGRVHLSGFLAWLAWGLIHILYLIGFRNRAIVMFEWAWAYVTRRSGVRLITSR